MRHSVSLSLTNYWKSRLRIIARRLYNPYQITEQFDSFIHVRMDSRLFSITYDYFFYNQYINLSLPVCCYLLSKLSADMPSGLDNIPTELIKIPAPIISSSLSKLFNISLMTGFFPNDWKIAKVMLKIIKIITERSPLLVSYHKIFQQNYV